MGWMKSIKKAAGKVFTPIVKGLDKITGGKFSKIMNNKWVKYALIAVAVVTGGIAIANGLMAAGQAGVGAAAKAFATNMSMETGKTLLSAVVEGGKQFVVGVAKGLSNPLGSDAGQAVKGFFDSTVGSITGAPVTGADQLKEITAGGTRIGDAAAKASSGAMDIAGASSAPIPMPSPPAGAFGGGASAEGFMPPTGIQVPGMPSAVSISPAGSSVGSLAGQAAPVMETDLLSKLAGSAKSVAGGVGDYLQTPAGMYQAGSALQGWSQGQALQERWDAMNDLEKERYRSWTDGSFKMPRLTRDVSTVA